MIFVDIELKIYLALCGAEDAELDAISIGHKCFKWDPYMLSQQSAIVSIIHLFEHPT